MWCERTPYLYDSETVWVRAKCSMSDKSSDWDALSLLSAVLYERNERLISHAVAYVEKRDGEKVGMRIQTKTFIVHTNEE